VLCVFVDRVMCVVPRTHVPVNSSSPLTPNKYVRLNVFSCLCENQDGSDLVFLPLEICLTLM